MVRVAVVGLGWWGRIIVQLLKGSAKIRAVKGIDPSPLAAPFAIATVIGGIDNTESALAAGDEYRTRDILLTEAVATAVAGLCGGVIQNTPYIGHPAYKAMGARAGYTLATALVIGVGGAVGAVSVLVSVLPVLLLRWIPPPTSAVMLARTLGEGRFQDYQWVPLERIAPDAALAVVAATLSLLWFNRIL